MGVRKVGRCRLVVDGREFVYWLPNEGACLRVASIDKKFVVSYQLAHSADSAPVLRVSGREFPGVDPGEKRPVYVVPPPFTYDRGPKTLGRAIVRWSLRPGRPLNRVPRPAIGVF